ncbi:ATP-dependent dsDNA exonuclease [Oceanicaulis sp. HTCC2633]|uniref:ATP-dependent dsDNA exonuclease n=1 Tax=Oceanicaulis sp. HTCC2633 TaxID=314254 RepID=UPI000066A215|nr:ATP-dependent dsDNA exonuclease [Oceanicaulis sp. HTCC2633]EAP90057.1 ATP-dependent dsDNA exonuclease [Oceanicaulis sp. HTCC2633]
MSQDEHLDPGGMPLLLHIGSGASSDAAFCADADTVLLVEPDPQLAQKARVWLSETAQGRVVQAAVADSVGQAALNCVSYAKMSSVRAMTGALDLYPGLQVLRAEQVATVRPRDLLQEYEGEVRKGGCGLIVGAPSEAYLVLSDLHASGLLAGFGYIQIDAGEHPLHEGGASKATCETWARDHNYSVQWGRSAADPNLHVGRLNYDWSAAYQKLTLLKERLEADVREARQAYKSAVEEVSACSDSLEEALTRLKSKELELEDVQETLAAENDALRAELESSKRSFESALASEQQALKLKTEQADQLNDSYLKERKDRESLESELKRLQALIQDEMQKNQKLLNEVEDLREDNRLSLRMQRMAQADLADLQSRFMTLATEKSQLEESLDKISSYMKSEISQRREIGVNPGKAKKKSKRVTSKERPISKSGESSDG